MGEVGCSGGLNGKNVIRDRTHIPAEFPPNSWELLCSFFVLLTTNLMLLSPSLSPGLSAFPPSPLIPLSFLPSPERCWPFFLASLFHLPVFLLLGPDGHVARHRGLLSRTTAFGFLNALCKLAAVLGISIFTSFVGITKAAPILFASAALALGSSLALKLPETRGQVLQ